MPRWVAWAFAGGALVFAGLTFLGSYNLALAEGLAGASVACGVIAGLALYESSLPGEEAAPPRIEHSLSPTSTGMISIEHAFQEGPFGRERIVVALDAVERATRDPNRPATTPDELRELRALPPAAFDAYVAQRLDQLEGGT